MKQRVQRLSYRIESCCFNSSLCSGARALTILKANCEVVLALGLRV